MNATLGLRHHRAGAIPRVVRRGAKHLCGLCRRHYDDHDTARQCVRQCWQELLTLDPVVIRRHGPIASYRCRFCARDYSSHAGAADCAADCRRHFESQADWTDDLASLDLEATRPVAPRPKARPAMRAAPSLRLVSRTPAPAKTSTAAPITVDVMHKPEEAAPVAATTLLEDANTEDSGTRKAKKKGDKPFYREGARYVCCYCHAKYFTRDEVVKCFDSHDG